MLKNITGRVSKITGMVDWSQKANWWTEKTSLNKPPKTCKHRGWEQKLQDIDREVVQDPSKQVIRTEEELHNNPIALESKKPNKRYDRWEGIR